MRGQGVYGDPQSPDEHRDWRDGSDDADRHHRGPGEHHRGGFHPDAHPHHHGFRADHDADRGGPSGAPGSDEGSGLHPGQHGHAADAPVAPHGADDFGWNDAAWADAGGFEAVLIGHLLAELAHAGGAAPFVVVPIDHLDLTFNSFVENTFVQNTQVVFDAANGGSVAVGGDVNTVALQHAFDQPAGLPDIQHLA